MPKTEAKPTNDSSAAAAAPLPSRQSWRVAPGDERFVFFAGVAKPIDCGSKERARMVAATPELLEALQALRADVECYCLDRAEMRGRGVCPACMATAAITKATQTSQLDTK